MPQTPKPTLRPGRPYWRRPRPRKTARGLNPLNTDHTANLARLNRRWAELAADAAVRTLHAQASNTYYSQAVQLSPNNAGLWNEWAALEFQVLNDQASAQKYLDQSLSIDQEFEQTYLLQGDLYSTQARAITDTVAQKPCIRKPSMPIRRASSSPRRAVHQPAICA